MIDAIILYVIVGTSLIEGSFLQLDSSTILWDNNQWLKELTYMQKLGMNVVIVQYMVDNDQAFYPTKLEWIRPLQQEPLEAILSVCDSLNIEVFVGDRYEWNFKFHDSTYFLTAAFKINKIIEELWERYGRHKSFKGWYIAQEYSNEKRFVEKQVYLSQFLRSIAEKCHTISGKPVAIAPFFFPQDTNTFKEFYTYILREGQIDIIMLQDGIGSRNCDLINDIPVYFNIMSSICNMLDPPREFWADLEIFDTVKENVLVPADIERIIAQILVEKLYASKIVCFEFNHYMSPLKGEEQQMLYNKYKKYKTILK